MAYGKQSQLMTGSLLAAFTAAIAASAGAAHATNYVSTTLGTPLTFDLLSSTSSTTNLNLGSASFAITAGARSIGDYSISLTPVDMNNRPVALVSMLIGFNALSDIGTYADYNNAPGSTPKLVGSGNFATSTGLSGDPVDTSLVGGSGYVALFLGKTPAYLSYTNSLSTTNGVQDDILTITGYGIAAAVPEPAVWAMMVLGVAGVGAAMRRRRSAEAFAV